MKKKNNNNKKPRDFSKKPMPPHAYRPVNSDLKQMGF